MLGLPADGTDEVWFMTGRRGDVVVGMEGGG